MSSNCLAEGLLSASGDSIWREQNQKLESTGSTVLLQREHEGERAHTALRMVTMLSGKLPACFQASPVLSTNRSGRSHSAISYITMPKDLNHAPEAIRNQHTVMMGERRNHNNAIAAHQMSQAGVHTWPRCSSGAMYWNVPTPAVPCPDSNVAIKSTTAQ